jgi:putative ABC transport system substrate-binding protein
MQVPSSILRATTAIAQWSADALLVVGSAPFGELKVRIGSLALQHRLPCILPDPLFLAPGDLGYYTAGGDSNELPSTMARQIDQILRGTKPADIPVVQPVRFTLRLSRSALNSLGIQIPDDVLPQITGWID